MSKTSPSSVPVPPLPDLRTELDALKADLATSGLCVPTSERPRGDGSNAVLFRLLPGLSPEYQSRLESMLRQMPWMLLPLQDDAYPALRRLQDKIDELAHAVEHDDLTGLARRAVFEKALDTEMERAKRSGRSLSLAILDIDDFKRINDTCGHVHGDHVLCSVAEILRRNVRRADLAVRLGGEEFALLMPATTQTSAVFLLERIMNAVRELRFDCPQPFAADQAQVTVSAGLACYKGFRDMLPLELIEQADQALYRAKKAGKNRLEKAPLRDISPELSPRTLVESAEKNFLFQGLAT
ncbi:GGDEF domain-containing protein [Desulfonatronum thioautotrophicum]|uniref:GGDEF domain-containing protein n=1 Tax=Desulfonatronum thioautotrophicum TaxID=617001 RepID=UPI0005EB59EF|nr:GGDEF domain-containing protein [Desulfonatronum thioautotrophicum]